MTDQEDRTNKSDNENKGLKTSEGYLESRPFRKSPGAHVVHGLSINFVSQLVKLSLALLSTVVLTRLLTPADFGLVAMVVIIVGLVATFRDAGLGMATVQNQDLKHTQVSALFWITIGLSLLAALLLAAIAPLIATFFDETRLSVITICLAMGVVVSGAGIQHIAILQRNMQFKSLALAQITALTCGLAVAITLAAEGFGHWALISNVLVTVTLETALCWILCKWRPSRPAWDPSVVKMLRFGGALSGFNFINYFSRNGDNLLVGWRWGADSLGLYSRAYELIMLPIRHINAPLGSVAIPLLSRLQDDQTSFQRMYCRFANLIAWLTVPLVSYMCINSKHIVSILWGASWSMAAPLLQVLALAALGQSILSSTGWIYVARDKTDVMLKVGALTAVITIAAFVIGLPYGAIGVATAYAIAVNVLILPLLYVACRSTQIDFSALIKSIQVPAVLSAFASLIAFGTGSVIDNPMPALALVTSGLSFAAVFAIGYTAWPACRSEAQVVVAEIRERLAK